ncbi:MAG: hypothetical protein LBI70_03840 [Rickettsiales bacterium]|nr:hypothetical protein [Rickettsiales bacterium]
MKKKSPMNKYNLSDFIRDSFRKRREINCVISYRDEFGKKNTGAYSSDSMEILADLNYDWSMVERLCEDAREIAILENYLGTETSVASLGDRLWDVGAELTNVLEALERRIRNAKCERRRKYFNSYITIDFLLRKIGRGKVAQDLKISQNVLSRFLRNGDRRLVKYLKTMYS